MGLVLHTLQCLVCAYVIQKCHTHRRAAGNSERDLVVQIFTKPKTQKFFQESYDFYITQAKVIVFKEKEEFLFAVADERIVSPAITRNMRDAKETCSNM